MTFEYQRRPGDQIVRVLRLRTERVVLAPRLARRPLPSPQLIFVGSFAGLILVGWLLLLLPFATAPGQSTTVLDALFTATSAVCVTGLVVVDTGTHWSPFGQAVILALIQLGGLGFMTLSTLLFLFIRGRTTLHERVLLRESLGVTALGSGVRLAIQVAALTLAIELVGVIFFWPRFALDVPLGTALWRSVFHSVSAFNNAGFDLFGDFRSLMPYRSDPYVLLTTAALIILGGISFTFMADFYRVRVFRRLALDSKLVLVTSLGLWLVGTVVVLLIERNNARTLGLVALPQQLLDAFFLAVTARTAGFNHLDLGLLEEQTLFFIMALMFIGAASGSTGGGIKVNTFSLLFLAVWSAITGKTRIEGFGREVTQDQVSRALAIALLALALVFLAALVLATTEIPHFLLVFFEAVSAFGTVGLSVSVTPALSEVGRFAIIFLMFAGRVGPLTLVLALNLRQRRVRFRYPVEEIKIG